MDKDEILKILIAQSSLAEFRKEVRDAILGNDLNTIKNILFSDKYPHYNQAYKETQIFQVATMLYLSSSITTIDIKKGEEVLKYLIFEYNIKEETSIDKTGLPDEIKEMFSIRKFHKDLNQELDVKNKLSNKVKI